ncbi:MAG: hypothetical protein CLLPBCKN_000684 [Chroococcidiopsis cubana SAG 39.79]|nr:hypothetical protein [Chroococcidiopsis cubana SAG 39.79]
MSNYFRDVFKVKIFLRLARKFCYVESYQDLPGTVFLPFNSIQKC